MFGVLNTKQSRIMQLLSGIGTWEKGLLTLTAKRIAGTPPVKIQVADYFISSSALSELKPISSSLTSPSDFSISARSF